MLLHCGPFRLELSRPLVMGIVNVTPDSFSDGGQHLQREAALAHARQLIAEGADIIDIGGESTRPGAQPVGLQEELDRVLPIIEGLRGAPVPVSIDTCKPQVMQAAIAAGEAAGIGRERIVIDPGFGFGKTLEHNLDLLRQLGRLRELGAPLLAGLSCKAMLGALTGQDVEHRVSASVAAALIAVQRGAAIVRVHDVRETVDALKIWNAVNY